MELITVNNYNQEPPFVIDDEPAKEPRKINQQFIQSNTDEIDLEHLKRDCIIPNFSRDNETTIAHQEFIGVVQEAVYNLFPNEQITNPDIRISHQIKGRIPDAIGKPAKDLQDFEKTIYYERMAFTINLPTIRNVVNGNELSLSVGGVRAYNQENLYSKKTMEKFKVFIGFQNSVCTNLCINTDGFKSEIRASNPFQLKEKILELFQGYNMNQHLQQLHTLGDYELTESQFAHFIGRARLYHYLPKKLKSTIPLMEFSDSQISTVAKSYFDDDNFSSSSNESINLWNLYNLFTGATKSSYIDTFLERTVNAHQLTKGFMNALNGDEKYKWFLG